ncbi:MAG: response regulator [Cyanobacteria bacterium]|nr:response regulator [Cyanobacteria bacterium CG_2015-16_32_12]NCO79076.1 response regulator [Cyanobacteria bacterium CG_2015-22_32_23]NCQ03667.1 response regulator [Cyanobacteria bacterium CG_2015-09_32_10]NCQ43241.1 response regulator [Cyanobacteria bacterium CG_2015-04_32_10]NCS85826.1 response regulator [Cyanobacteria bacterium CG_2015-02_32_10]
MKKILVVDDSKSQQMLVNGLLKNIGAEIFIANNGESALGWLEENGQPDLILMDIVMPDMSGLDVCRHIRKEMNYKTVPIIFVTTKDEDFDKFWALRQGGNGYITKPYSPIDLINTVKNYL